MQHKLSMFPALSLIVALPLMVRFANASEALNDKVVEYCKDNIDKTVGSGECAALAFQALKAAGAKTRNGPDTPQPRDYNWGKRVYMIEANGGNPKETGDVKDVLPGDIIQYRDTKFITAHFAHHTSVVKEVNVAAKKIEVYQQNVGGKRFVVGGLVQLNKLSEGYIVIYRPVPER